MSLRIKFSKILIRLKGTCHCNKKQSAWTMRALKMGGLLYSGRTEQRPDGWTFLLTIRELQELLRTVRRNHSLCK